MRPALRKGSVIGVGLWLAAAPAARGQESPEPASEMENPAAPPSPVVMDRIVAVVGDRLITASDIALEVELNARDPSPERATARRNADPLRALIDAAVVRGLAGQVPLYQPSPAELRVRLAALRATWEDPADYERFLVRFGLTEDALSGLLFSRVIVERYVHRNVSLASEMRGLDPGAAEQEYEARVLSWRESVPCRLVPMRSVEGGAGAAPGPCP